MSGKSSDTGPLENLKNIPLQAGCCISEYKVLVNSALEFLSSFDPDILIVCAGYDALESDPMAGVSLYPDDFGEIARLIRHSFTCPTVFGLEGGYDVEALPLAVESTLRAYK